MYYKSIRKATVFNNWQHIFICCSNVFMGTGRHEKCKKNYKLKNAKKIAAKWSTEYNAALFGASFWYKILERMSSPSLKQAVEGDEVLRVPMTRLRRTENHLMQEHLVLPTLPTQTQYMTLYITYCTISLVWIIQTESHPRHNNCIQTGEAYKRQHDLYFWYCFQF